MLCSTDPSFLGFIWISVLFLFSVQARNQAPETGLFPFLFRCSPSRFFTSVREERGRQKREEGLVFVTRVQVGQGREGREVADVFKSTWC